MTQEASQILDEVKVAAYEIKVAGLAAEMGVALTESDILASSGQWLHSTGGGIKSPLRRPFLAILAKQRARDVPWIFPIDEYSIDLESGLKTKEVVCKCCWFEKCPKCDGYGRPANNRIERTVKELKDNDNALKFIPAETVKDLKENGYVLEFIPVEAVKVSKDDDPALKFIHVEMVKKLKEDGYALFAPNEMAKKLKEDGYTLLIPVEMAKKLKDATIEEAVNKSFRKRFAEWFGYANDYIEKTVKPDMGILFSGATMQNIYQLATSGMMTTGKGKTLMKLNEAAFMMLLYGHIMPRRAAGHIALAIGVALASAAYLVTMSFAF